MARCSRWKWRGRSIDDNALRRRDGTGGPEFRCLIGKSQAAEKTRHLFQSMARRPGAAAPSGAPAGFQRVCGKGSVARKDREDADAGVGQTGVCRHDVGRPQDARRPTRSRSQYPDADAGFQREPLSTKT
jgi:hypothetical protein